MSRRNLVRLAEALNERFRDALGEMPPLFALGGKLPPEVAHPPSRCLRRTG